VKIQKGYRLEGELVEKLKKAVDEMNKDKTISDFKWTETLVIEHLIEFYIPGMLRDEKENRKGNSLI
jgi:hypothetical protein